MRATTAGLLLLCSLPVTLPASAEPSFVPLGTLANGSFECRAQGISPDGLVVVGGCDVVPGGAPGAAEAFRWDEVGGIVGLGHLSGNTYSRALDIAADGATVVGYSGPTLCGRCDEQAVIWASTGMIPLGATEGGSTARGISDDGSVVVGHFGGQAFRWTSTGGLDLPLYGLARAVSSDGATVVGQMFDETAGYLAYRWTDSEGATVLSPDSAGATGISSDASTIVGATIVSSFEVGEPFRWTASSGFTTLGTLPLGADPAAAQDTCATGEIIVGETRGSPRQAFVWDARNGMQALQLVLEAQGVDLSGWALTQATAISDDCRRIVGWGTNPSGDVEGFVGTVDLPLPDLVPDLPASSTGSRIMAGVLLIAAGLAAARKSLRSDT
jgi:uncharacterized membrane protein